jgi:hypothetical protein
MKYSLTKKEWRKAKNTATANIANWMNAIAAEQPDLMRPIRGGMSPVDKAAACDGNAYSVVTLCALKKKYGATATVTVDEYRSSLLQAVELFHHPEKRASHASPEVIEELCELAETKGTPNEMAYYRDVARHALAVLLALTKKFDAVGPIPEQEVAFQQTSKVMVQIGGETKVTTVMQWQYDFDGDIALRKGKSAIAEILTGTAEPKVGYFFFDRLNVVDLKLIPEKSVLVAMVEWFYWPLFPASSFYQRELTTEETKELFNRSSKGWSNLDEFGIRHDGDGVEGRRAFKAVDYQAVEVSQEKERDPEVLSSFDPHGIRIGDLNRKETVWDWHVGAERPEFTNRELHPDMLTQQSIADAIKDRTWEVENLRFRLFELRVAQPALAAYLEIPEPRSVQWKDAQLWDYAALEQLPRCLRRDSSGLGRGSCLGSQACRRAGGGYPAVCRLFSIRSRSLFPRPCQYDGAGHRLPKHRGRATALGQALDRH